MNTTDAAIENIQGELTDTSLNKLSISRFASIRSNSGKNAATITAAQIRTSFGGRSCNDPPNASINSTAKITNDTKNPTETLRMFVTKEKLNALGKGMRFLLFNQKDSSMEKQKKQIKKRATASHSTVFDDIFSSVVLTSLQ